MARAACARIGKYRRNARQRRVCERGRAARAVRGGQRRERRDRGVVLGVRKRIGKEAPALRRLRQFAGKNCVLSIACDAGN